MDDFKVELKRIKTFRGMEGYGMNADIYVNGVKTAFVIDDANGGCYNYEVVQTPQAKANFELLENFIKTLPKVKSTIDDFEFDMDMDLFIGEIMDRREKEKFEAKKQKLFATAIVLGVPNSDKYSFLNYKKPLSLILKNNLQKEVDNAKERYCKDGVVILNNNLEALGIKI